MITSLFEIPAAAPPQKTVGQIPLRFYQREDVDALIHALEGGYNRPCCVSATGSGKSVCEAELAGRLADNGKALVIVDRANLVHQLAEEIERHLPDFTCGRIADGVCQGLGNRIIVSTVQAMYTPGRDGRPLYEYPQFDEVKTVLIDELHKFYSPVFQSVPYHFEQMNGSITVGFTATPSASSGARWDSFMNWTAGAEGPCMRTIPWCVRNGYLVPMRQAFVKVNLHLSEVYDRLKSTGDDDDEQSGDELSGLLLDLLSDKHEQDAAAFAKGVAEIIGDRKAIIFSPARVAAAKLLASWLNPIFPCGAVWGAKADKADVLERFKNGRPQAMSAVNILSEGFDHPGCSAVFICRLIKDNWRMITQMAGRCLRPAKSCTEKLFEFDHPDQAEQRRIIIAESEKPDAIVADLVGIDGKLLQASAIDILYNEESDDIRAEMALIAHARQSRPKDETSIDDDLRNAARSEIARKQNERLAEMARHRGMAGDLGADVEVSFHSEHGINLPSVPAPIATATIGEQAMFVAMATQYDLDRATGIAARTPRNQLKGMTFSMKRNLDKQGIRPDWVRARRAFPAWAAEKNRR